MCIYVHRHTHALTHITHAQEALRRAAEAEQMRQALNTLRIEHTALKNASTRVLAVEKENSQLAKALASSQEERGKLAAEIDRLNLIIAQVFFFVL
jgi:hypothetical protein